MDYDELLMSVIVYHHCTMINPISSWRKRCFFSISACKGLEREGLLSLGRQYHKEIISGRMIEILLEIPFSKCLFYWSLLKREDLSDYFLINILLALGQALKCGLNHLYSGKAEKKFVLAK